MLKSAATITSRALISINCRRSYHSASVDKQKNEDLDLYDIELDFYDEFFKDPSNGRANKVYAKALEGKFKESLGCTKSEAKMFIERNRKYFGESMQLINKNIEFLTSKRVSAAVIMDNPWLIGLPSGELAMNQLNHPQSY